MLLTGQQLVAFAVTREMLSVCCSTSDRFGCATTTAGLGDSDVTWRTGARVTDELAEVDTAAVLCRVLPLRTHLTTGVRNDIRSGFRIPLLATEAEVLIGDLFQCRLTGGTTPSPPRRRLCIPVFSLSDIRTGPFADADQVEDVVAGVVTRPHRIPAADLLAADHTFECPLTQQVLQSLPLRLRIPVVHNERHTGQTGQFRLPGSRWSVHTVSGVTAAISWSLPAIVFSITRSTRRPSGLSFRMIPPRRHPRFTLIASAAIWPAAGR